MLTVFFNDCISTPLSTKMGLFSLSDAVKALMYRMNPTAIISIFLVNTFRILYFYHYYYKSYFKGAVHQIPQELLKRCFLWAEMALLSATIIVALLTYIMACLKPTAEDNPTTFWRPLRVALIALTAFEVLSQGMFLHWYGFGHLSSYRPCFHLVSLFGVDVCVLAGFYLHDQPDRVLAKQFSPWLKY